MIEAGLTGAVASAVRYLRRAIAMLATAGGEAVAGSAASSPQTAFNRFAAEAPDPPIWTGYDFPSLTS